MKTIAVIDFKAGKGTYKAYEVDRAEYPEHMDICDALMGSDVYKIDIYENGVLVFTERNSI